MFLISLSCIVLIVNCVEELGRKQGCELEAFLIEFEFESLNFNFSSSSLSSQNRVEKIQSE